MLFGIREVIVTSSGATVQRRVTFKRRVRKEVMIPTVTADTQYLNATLCPLVRETLKVREIGAL